MNKREQLLAALKGDTGYIPMDIDFNFVAAKKYEPIFGKDYHSYFNLDHRSVALTYNKFDHKVFEKYHSNLPEGTEIDDFGIGLYRNEASELYFHPMKNFTTLSELEQYPFPEYSNPEFYVQMKNDVDAIHGAGLAAIGKLIMTIFPIAWELRSMDELLCDMALHSDIGELLFEKILKNRIDIAKGIAASGADILWLGDDVATQDRLFMSLEMWREWIKPCHSAIIRAAKKVNPNIMIAFHCCGYVTPIVRDLIEIGVEILNPIQPESVNILELKSEYGSRLAFWGGLSVQKILPFGTPNDVRNEVLRLVNLMGKGGRYVLCPSHHIAEDVPIENIFAFYDTYKILLKERSVV